MNTCEGDILDLDFDPDVLIHLLGKLSLDNIPTDVSEALSSLENRNDERAFNIAEEIQRCASSNREESFLSDPIALKTSEEYALQSATASSQVKDETKNYFLSSFGGTSDSHGTLKNTKETVSSLQENTIVPKEQDKSVLQGATASSELEDENKIRFLSLIGLVSDSRGPLNRTKGKRSASSLQDNATEKHIGSLSKSDNNSKQNQNELLPVSAAKCSTKTVPQKPKKSWNRTWSSPDFINQKMPCTSIGDSLSNLSELRQQGRIFDIQLNDMNSIKCDLQRLPFFSFEETSDYNCDKSFHGDATVIQESDSNDSLHNSLFLSKRSIDLSDKCSNSQDSGYDTSSSTISPSPPLVNTETFNSAEFFGDALDDELDDIVATIVEVENSMILLEASPSNVNVPVLKDAKNPEDHKEKILNFLKESVSTNSAQDAASMPNNLNSSPLEIVQENIPKKDSCVPDFHITKKSPNSSRKSPLKAKDRKLGYELKYASKNDLGHLLSSSMGKTCFEKSKILKQLQDDERAQKKVKLMQLMDKKLKRTAADDRENKKRRRLLSSKEENFSAKILV